MAKVNFNNIDDEALNTSSNTPGSDVGFFQLKNDGDEAIVRFLCDSVDEFEILTVHNIKLGDKYRKVNCIRDPREPLENCPLCAAGEKINQRFFIKMIQYVPTRDNATGVQTLTPKAMVWERAVSYAKTLKSYLDNYGPLSDVICKIIRHGKAGDMQTTYEIVPNLSKAVYRDEVYVKDMNLFGDFNALGTFVMDRSYEDIAQFVATGTFPEKQTQAKEQAEVTPRTYDSAPVNAPVNTYVPTQPVPDQSAPVYTQPSTGGPSQMYSPTPSSAVPRSWDNSSSVPTGGFERPARRY